MKKLLALSLFSLASLGGILLLSVSLKAENNTLLNPFSLRKSAALSKSGTEIFSTHFHIGGVHASQNQEEIVVEYSPAAALSLFRYDNGMLVDGISLTQAGPRGVIGTAFPEIRSLEQVQWALYGTSVNNRKVNIFIFGLDATGKPVLPVLYSAESVDCSTLTLNTLSLDSIVMLRQGCFIGFSSADDQNLSLGLDDGMDAEWPFTRKVNYLNTDFLNSAFQQTDAMGLSSNIFIRGIGKKESDPENMPGHYRIWRFATGQEEKPDQWQLLQDAYTETNTYIDDAYSSLAPNVYFYAVDTANSTENLPAFSNPVFKDMHTSLEINLSTSIPAISFLGANASLTGTSGYVKDLQISRTADSSNTILFEQLVKGTYRLIVEYPGFKTEEQSINLSTDNQCRIHLTLHEHIDKPWDLSATQTALPQHRIIEWNPITNIYEDAEGHEDFAINSPGALGWSYIDGDKGIPYGIQGCNFPNTGLPLAFMAFNPGRTSPVLTNLPQAIPHSGEKYFAAFANMPASQGAAAPANNDFLISPELKMASDFQFDFYAKSYDKQYPEQFRVWYSTSGKEQTDFCHELTSGPVTASDEWKLYRYTVPQEARYVAVNYVSQDQFIFMVDDLRFTEDRSQAIPLGYEISIDNKVLDTMQETRYETGMLTQGEHTVSIRALHKTGQSESTSLKFKVEDHAAYVKALVRDIENAVIANAKALLSGNFAYQTYSNAEGILLIGPIQGQQNYHLTVQAENFKEISMEVKVGSEDTIDLGILALPDEPKKPGTVYAEVSNNGNELELSWRTPADYTLFRKDDGKVEGGLGSNTGTEKTVVGAVHTGEATLYNMSWLTATQGASTINLFVFDLDQNGMPTKNILYKAFNVANIGLEWNTYYFEQPVYCPNGFLLGVSGTGMGNVGLGADSGRDSIWPFIPKTNYLIFDYEASDAEFSLLDPQFTRNLLIRAEGSKTRQFQKHAESKGVKAYMVYRMKANQETIRWECLTPEPITSTSFLDKEWTSLEKGYYQYAVESIYSNGDHSEKAYSNHVSRKMQTSVEIAVSLPDGNPVAEATVNLRAETGGNFSTTTNSEGKAIFADIATDLYTLTIQKESHADFILYEMDFQNENYYKLGPYVLGDPIPAPNGLILEAGNTANSCIARWQAAETEAKKSCIASNQADFFRPGNEPKNEFVIYVVYVDGQRYGETAETFLAIGELSTGEHLVSVRARKGNHYSPAVESGIRISTSNDTDTKALIAKVCPNPVGPNGFHVSCPEPIEEIRLTNLQGRVRTLGFEAKNGEVYVKENLPEGVYILEAVSGKNVFRFKLVVL